MRYAEDASEATIKRGGLELSRYEFLDCQRQHSAAIGAEQCCFLTVAVEDGNFNAVTICAASRWLAGYGFGKLDDGLGVELTGLPGVDLKRAATIGTDMIEAALRLAGVDDISAVALGTPDEVFYGH